jgi:hypothetical protein
MLTSQRYFELCSTQENKYSTYVSKKRITNIPPMYRKNALHELTKYDKQGQQGMATFLQHFQFCRVGLSLGILYLSLSMNATQSRCTSKELCR